MIPLVAEIHELEPLADGRYSVRYRYVDPAGVEHVTSSRIVPPGTDLVAAMDRAWDELAAALVEAELAWIEAEVLEGRNSFGALRYVPVERAAVHVMRKLLADSDLLRVARAAPLLSAFTDGELSALLEIDLAKVADIRAAAARAMSALQAADGYQAVL